MIKSLFLRAAVYLAIHNTWRSGFRLSRRYKFCDAYSESIYHLCIVYMYIIQLFGRGRWVRALRGDFNKWAVSSIGGLSWGFGSGRYRSCWRKVALSSSTWRSRWHWCGRCGRWGCGRASPSWPCHRKAGSWR